MLELTVPNDEVLPNKFQLGYRQCRRKVLVGVMPNADPSGVDAGEVLWGSDPLNHPYSMMLM